jgi:hypothetical protein
VLIMCADHHHKLFALIRRVVSACVLSVQQASYAPTVSCKHAPRLAHLGVHPYEVK